MGDLEELDRAVRLGLYRRFVDDGHAPVAATVAGDLGVAPVEVERSYRRLQDGHVIVLAPSSPYIWMANPLSALPTGYRVTIGDRGFWGNCIWDALGIVAMLGGTGRVDVVCADCGEDLHVEVDRGELADTEAVIHYAVPARHWWDAIGFS